MADDGPPDQASAVARGRKAASVSGPGSGDRLDADVDVVVVVAAGVALPDDLDPHAGVAPSSVRNPTLSRQRQRRGRRSDDVDLDVDVELVSLTGATLDGGCDGSRSGISPASPREDNVLLSTPGEGAAVWFRGGAGITVLAPLGTVVARLRRGGPPSVALLTFARSHAADDQPAVSDGAFHLLPAEGILRLGKLSH
jgi:hypothetical protein